MWHDMKVRGPFTLTTDRLAFPVESSWRPVGVLMRQSEPDAPVRARVFGDPSDVDAALAQTARILSLDVDGSDFPAVGLRDPVVARLQRHYPGARPVSFHSPYEAACWAILSHRVRIPQAAGVKQRLTERFGATVEVDGVAMPTFPAPDAWPARIPLVNEVKSDRLHSVAQAALAGHLDAATLRALPTAEALTRLRALPGIGPFSAELILLRGAATPDAFPEAEPRLHDEMAHQYGLTTPTVTDLTEIAETWRPYRMWVSVLLRTLREEQTAEIATGRRTTRAS